MALGINQFTTQEALNVDAYNDWNYEELDLGTVLGGYVSSSYIIATNPAKKVVIYPVPGQTVAANDNLYLYLNDTISNSTSLLDENLNDSEVTVDVDDENDFSAGDVLLVDAELMKVQSALSPTLIVTRGYGTSTAVTHDNNTIIWKVGTPSNHSTSSSINPIMKLGVDQLPFTMSGIIITYLNMWNTGAANNANDDISILSFH